MFQLAVRDVEQSDGAAASANIKNEVGRIMTLQHSSGWMERTTIKDMNGKCWGTDWLSHPVFKTNQVLPICMTGTSFIHIVTSSVNNRNNIT